MTYTGKPSRGCEACRNMHVKCDERRPECSRCARLKRVCNGYRSEVDLIFRVEGNSGSILRKNERLRKFKDFYASSVREVYSDVLPDVQLRQNTLFQLPDIGRSLFPSRDEQTLCYFYEFITGTLSECDHSRYLHLQLPALFSRSRQDSALCLAVQAISHAVWAKHKGNRKNTMEVSRRLYVQSISALKVAIQNPIEVKSDEILYAVLLLCGYETITLNSDVQSAWGSHLDGAVALLRIRGKEQLSTPLQCNMFLFIRRNAVHSNIQLSQPVDPIFGELADTALSFENTEDQLLSKTIKVPQLQSVANDILSQPVRSATETQIFKLIRDAENLDHELANWARGVPSGWSYSVATNLKSLLSAELSTPYYIPFEIHGYADFYIARVWNLYRVSRLIIQSVLLRASASRYSSRASDRQDNENKLLQNSSGELVNGICASVPFLLGYDLSQLKRPTAQIICDDKAIWPQSSTSKVGKSKDTGRFSLIWPLYISCSVSSIPESQRWWMHSQLQWIAKYGEPQAQLVSGAKSRTLLGGPEAFRFDCA